MVRARAAVAVARRGARPAATGLHRRRRWQPGRRQTRRTGGARAGGPAASIAIPGRSISWRRKPSGRSSSRWCDRAPVTDPRSTTRRHPTTPRCPMTRRCPTIRRPAIRRPQNRRLRIGAAGRCRPTARRRSVLDVPRLVDQGRSGVTRAHADRSRNGATAVRVPAAPDPNGATGAPSQAVNADRSPSGATAARVPAAPSQSGETRARNRKDAIVAPPRVGPSPSGAIAPRQRVGPSPSGETRARNRRVVADRSRSGAIVAPPRVGPNPSGATAPPRRVGPNPNGATGARVPAAPSPTGGTAARSRRVRRGPKPEWRDRGEPECAWAQARVARQGPGSARPQTRMAGPRPEAGGWSRTEA